MRNLSNKEKKNLLKLLLEKYGIDIKDEIKKNPVLYDEENGIYFLNNKPIAFLYNNEIFPTIFLIIEKSPDLPYVIVDKGATKRILNGADVFRPGIIKAEKLEKGKITLIISENKELLGIGISLVNQKELEKMKKGKVIKNIHYFGDKITKLYYFRK